MATKRNEKGQFVKGSAPISPGRPKGVRARAKEAIETHGLHPFDFLAQVMVDTKEKTRERITAAKELLDRAYGKAPQHMTTESKIEVKDRISEEVSNVIDKLKEK